MMITGTMPAFYRPRDNVECDIVSTLADLSDLWPRVLNSGTPTISTGLRRNILLYRDSSSHIVNAYGCDFIFLQTLT